MPDEEPKNVTIQLSGAIMSMATGSARISSSVSGGRLFADTARRLAASAVRLDNSEIMAGLDNVGRGEHAGELMAVSLGATLTAYLSVESAVNDLFLAHTLGNAVNFKGLDQKLARTLSDAWETGAHKLNALGKADLIAVIAGAGKLKFGEGPAQRVRVLHDLRNELVHHKPKIVEHGRSPHESDDKLERQIRHYFSRAMIWSPPESVPFRWSGCLGAGCANWACAVADGFIRQVYAAAGTEFLMAPFP